MFSVIIIIKAEKEATVVIPQADSDNQRTIEPL
jgi:hypothetical protein